MKHKDEVRSPTGALDDPMKATPPLVISTCAAILFLRFSLVLVSLNKPLNTLLRQSKEIKVLIIHLCVMRQHPR
jgi:hypothetical protein